MNRQADLCVNDSVVIIVPRDRMLHNEHLHCRKGMVELLSSTGTVHVRLSGGGLAVLSPEWINLSR